MAVRAWMMFAVGAVMALYQILFVAEPDASVLVFVTLLVSVPLAVPVTSTVSVLYRPPRHLVDEAMRELDVIDVTVPDVLSHVDGH